MRTTIRAAVVVLVTCLTVLAQGFFNPPRRVPGTETGEAQDVDEPSEAAATPSSSQLCTDGHPFARTSTSDVEEVWSCTDGKHQLVVPVDDDNFDITSG